MDNYHYTISKKGLQSGEAFFLLEIITLIVLQCSYNIPIPLRSAIMINNAVVRARVNEEIKEEANIVLSSIGLTVSDAFRMMLFRIAHEKSLPFEPLIPNKTTIEAMKESRKGNLKSVNSIDQLFEELNAED